MDLKRFSWKRLSTVVLFTLLITTLVVNPVLAAATTPIFRLKWDSSDTSLTTYPELSPSPALYGPAAVEATDTRVYVTDTLNDRIQIFDSSGVFVAVIGPDITGPTPSYLAGPAGVTVDSSGNIYVADTGNHRVIKFDSALNYVTTVGERGSLYTKTPPVVQFRSPSGLALDSTGAYLYAVDTTNSRVLKLNAADLSPAGDSPLMAVGLATGLSLPKDVVVNTDDASIFVADTGNNRLVKIPVNGGNATASTISLNQPGGIDMDTNGNLYVANTNANTLLKLTNAMGTNKSWGTPGSGNGQVQYPTGIAALGEDVVYVADTNNDRVQFFEPNLVMTDLALSSTSITEGNTVNQVIGTFNTIDPNPMDAFRYEWLPTMDGETCDNNTYFNLSGANLTARYVYDFETRSAYNICVKVWDSNNQNYRAEAFPIFIEDGSDAPVYVTAPSAISLNEYSARSGNTTSPGLTVATVTITDNDVDDDFTYSIAGGSLAQAFQMVKDTTDKKKAYLKIWDNGATPPGYQTQLDYETAEVLTTTPTITRGGTVIVRVEDDEPGDPDRTTDKTFTITLNNQPDPPLINLPVGTFAVDELAPVGTVVGPQGVDCTPIPTPEACLITVTDPDAGTSLASLSLSFDPSHPSDYFNVQKVTSSTASLWKIVTKAALPDHFTYPTIDFYLRAYDNANYTWLTLPILNTDSNNAPVLFDDYYMHADRTVGYVLDLAADPDINDTLTYAILSGNTGDTFEVVNGKIQIKSDALIDYEYWQAQPIPYFELEVSVQDDAELPLGDTGWVRIHITEGNRPPVLVTNPAPTLTTPESTVASPLGANVVGHINVTDLDFNEVDITSDPAGPFVVSKTCFTPCNADVTVNTSKLNLIDYETTPAHMVDLTVTVSDRTAAPVTQTFQITLTNVNEPIDITNEEVPIPVNDGWGAGHVIGTVAWLDEDGNANTQPTFDISGDGADKFEIDPATGEISILADNSLHYYLQNVYQPTILIYDIPSGGFSKVVQFRIELSDDNDPPAFKAFEYATAPVNSLKENEPDGTVVGSFVAFDENGQDFNVTIDDINSPFSILSTETIDPVEAYGITMIHKRVTIAVADTTKIDYDTALNHQAALIMKGIELVTTPLSRNYTYNIDLANVNEPPVIENQQFYTYQNAEYGVVVGTIFAEDPDDGSTLTYEVVSGGTAGPLFELNTATGVISVKRGVSLQVIPGNYTMTVRGHDNSTPVEYSQNATITVIVTPKADPAVTTVAIPAPELLVGSAMRYNITVSNLSAGVSSTFKLQVKLPAGVGYELPGSTAGCVKITMDTVECPGAALQPQGQAGAIRNYVINAYIYTSTPPDATLKTIASLVLGDAFNDLIPSNNTNETAVFTTRKSITVTNQNFEGQAPQDFTKNNVAVGGTTAPACLANPQSFAGLFGKEQVKYTKDIISHSKVEVSFDLYLPYTWDGIGSQGPDLWKFCQGNCQLSTDFFVDTTFSNMNDYDQDDVPLHPQSFPNSFASGSWNLAQTGSAAVNTLGYHLSSTDPCIGTPMDSVYSFHFEFDHADPQLILNFLGDGDGFQTGLLEEEWGIDNFRVVIYGEDSYQIYLPSLRR